MDEQALGNLRVVEWGNFISAPYCTKLLADMGAEVIKIELPDTGDEARKYGPFPGDAPDSEKSGLFLYLNTNKLGITLNPTKVTGKDILRKLLKTADIFVENQPIHLMQELKLDFDHLKEINPRMIVTSITPFGQSGPYKSWKGYDINCCALGGIAKTIGYPQREPLTPPQNQGCYQAGLMAAIGTLFALFARDKNGKGVHLDISEAECWATFHIGIGIQTFIEEGRVRRRSGHFSPHRPYPDTVLPCKDGYVCIDTPQNRQWKKLLEVMGNPKWSKDPIFEDRITAADEHWEKADAYMSEWLMMHTKEEVFKLCQGNGVPAAPIRTVEEVVGDAQLKERNYFAEVDDPNRGKYKFPGTGYRFSQTPALFRRPAPRLGEHNHDIFCNRLGYSEADLVAWREGEVI